MLSTLMLTLPECMGMKILPIQSGFVIVFAGVPVMWQSKLQTETALSTMEAEIIALGSCCLYEGAHSHHLIWFNRWLLLWVFRLVM